MLTEEQKSSLSCREIRVQQVGSPRCLLINIMMDSRLERSQDFILTLLEISEVGEDENERERERESEV